MNISDYLADYGDSVWGPPCQFCGQKIKKGKHCGNEHCSCDDCGRGRQVECEGCCTVNDSDRCLKCRNDMPMQLDAVFEEKIVCLAPVSQSQAAKVKITPTAGFNHAEASKNE